MSVLLATYGSRGGVEPMVGLAVHLEALGVDVRVCGLVATGVMPIGASR
jgi:vancomycin aglycone glucosyltransferase